MGFRQRYAVILQIVQVVFESINQNRFTRLVFTEKIWLTVISYNEIIQTPLIRTFDILVYEVRRLCM